MIDKLEMFIAVAKEEHFGRAAESLGITQPTLSAGIKQLENQLGVQLVFRGSRYGGLTPEGQNALVWARRIVGDARQLREEMRFQRHGLSGHLRMAVIPSALTWAATLVARFSEAHPKVRFSVLSRTSAEVRDMLDNLEADVGISYIDQEARGRLLQLPLFDERYVVVCSPSAPLSGRAAVTWADLAQENLCLLSSDMQNRRIIDSNIAAAGGAPEARIESNSTLVLLATVASGAWATILSADTASGLVREAGLETIPIQGPQTSYPVGLLAPYREPHTPVLDAVLKLAQGMADAHG